MIMHCKFLTYSGYVFLQSLIKSDNIVLPVHPGMLEGMQDKQLYFESYTMHKHRPCTKDQENFAVTIISRSRLTAKFPNLRYHSIGEDLYIP